MMQSELLLPAWPSFNFTCLPLDPYNQETGFCGVDDSDFSYSFTSPGESSVNSLNSHIPTMLPDEFFDLKDLDDEIQIMSSGDIEEIREWIMDGEEGSLSSHVAMKENGWSPCHSFESNNNMPRSVVPVTNSSMLLPGDDMEVDDQLTLLHLLRAYGEAVENGEKELAQVIVNSINEKSSPSGSTVERVAYNLFQSRERKGEYLREESQEHFATAFKVMYQSLPNGRIAHFTANFAILESLPDHVATVHIVDFDIGEGIQWPQMIEALSRKKKAMRLTAITSKGEGGSYWMFEDTKKVLLAHASQYGVKLQIEEKIIEDIGTELRMNGREEWMVFNCAVGLPHMGRRRSRVSVEKFMKVAKEFLSDSRGIVILGDGEAKESLSNCCGYASYFDSLLRHYQAVFESLERNFPCYLAEARTAMESLFLAPFMCPAAWFQDWEEMVKGCDRQTEMSLKARKLSLESLDEAKQMISGGEASYDVKTEGTGVNGMVLRWRETPLVRVSTWV